ncbi:MAG: hypothetical protein DRJ47_10680 [Thermoprotei archaeon]|nr:MAG: hypothetical protein DRJ47_10680 [Thermoprotei archaeon]
MPKYTSYSELAEKAPKNWAKYTDPERYREGMNRIAPPGKRVKETRVTNYGKHTTEAEGKKWLENWSSAMFE